MSPADPGPVDRRAIEALIPHAGAMCLLDRITRWDDRTIEARTNTHRGADNPLRSEDRLPVEAGIEYAAQAMAAHGGLLGRGGAARRGYVAVVNRVAWSTDRLDTIDGELVIVAEVVQTLDDSRSYVFRLTGADTELVSGEALVVLEGAVG